MSTTAPKPAMRALISGAGIAGPALAWWLAKTGARITIVEKAPSIQPHGQNVDIEGSARHVVRRMGLFDEVKRYHTTEKGTQFIDTNGRPFAPFPVREDAKSASGTSELEILRPDLAKIFWEATREHPNVDYMFGTTVKEVLSNDEDAVKVQLSNGEVHEYDILVAADGQWSKIRQKAFPAEDVTLDYKNMNVAYFTIQRTPEDNDWWNLYQALRCRGITLRPDPYGTIRAMFTMMPLSTEQEKAWREVARHGDRATKAKFLRQEFGDAGWQTQRLFDGMEKDPDIYFQILEQVKMKNWSTGRIVCLGDAAHAPTPLTGAGTSLAILGGYVLAGELSKLTAGEHPSKAFQAYQTAFKPWVDNIQQVPWFVPGIAHPETAFRRWLFRVGITAVSKVVAMPWLASRFNWGDDEDYKLPIYPLFEEKKA